MNAPLSLRTTAAYRVLFDSSHPFDAGLAGYDGPTSPEHDGAGFRVVFNGSEAKPEVLITGPDGSVEIYGHAAIKQLTDALMTAEQLALRMEAERVSSLPNHVKEMKR